MAYTTINKSTDYFSTVLWTGTGAEQTVSGVGYQPDLTWVKRREQKNHNWFDSVRGATKHIYSNLTVGQDTTAETLKSWNADGFVLGTDTNVNANAGTYVAWNWKAGTTSGLSGGTITPSSYSINTTNGFGIYEYTGTGSNATIAHGLGTAPQVVLVKMVSGTEDWRMYHQGAGDATKYMTLNSTGAVSTAASVWNSTAPTSTLFSIGTDGGVNTNASTYIVYCFTEKTGFSKFSKYTGNGSTDGSFVYTGFKPAFVMAKCSSASGSYTSWSTFDTTREPYNLNAGKTLYANTDYAEGKRGNGDASTTIPGVDLLSNGFKWRVLNDEVNNSQDYVFMAFAEVPLVGSNNIPALAR